MLEGTLSKNCKKYFDSLGPDCLAIKKDQGPYSGKRGISDWLLCYKGRFIAIELKVGDNTTSVLQKHFLEAAAAAGATTAVCWFLDEVKEVIRKVDEEIEYLEDCRKDAEGER